ncbi:hypothetical protein DFH28DRAFT_890362 [Melampsora americana]|nr:hypothetical protein DFH28DRAFT_890362 [Melampsora americana]
MIKSHSNYIKNISTINSIYRRLIRIAIRMPDKHRIRFVGFCARREVQELIKISKEKEEEEFKSKLLEIETYADQLDHQAIFLSSNYHYSIPMINTHDSNSTIKSRKVIWAITEQKPTHPSIINNRFMDGPEPSWLRNRPKVNS